MRIQSKFKDYYDFVSHKFGEDPDIVYVRKPFKERTYVKWSCGDYFKDTISRWDGRRQVSEINSDLRFAYVVAGELVVTFIYNGADGTYTRLDEKIHEPFMQRYGDKFPRLPEGEALADLVRTVGAPVFLIFDISNGRYLRGKREKDTLCIAERVPVLSDMGFPVFAKAEAVWQGIYATLTNVLRKSPDKEPPVEVANKYKIHAAGFDLKTSFRHPVNQKKVKK